MFRAHKLLSGAPTVACLAVSAIAAAQGREPISARLLWERAGGAETCMSESQLRAAVEQRLGRPVFVERDADVVVRGTVRHERDHWQVSLELSSPDGRRLGKREISSATPHCTGLNDTIPLVLAIMLDVPKDRVRASSETEPPRTPPTTPPSAAQPDAQARQPERVPWKFDFGMDGLVSAGFVPGLGPGARLQVGAAPPRFWVVELDGGMRFGTSARVDGAGARFRSTDLGLLVCPYAGRFDQVELRLCAGQQAGLVRATGFGFDYNAHGSRGYISVGARAQGILRLVGPLGLSLSLEGLVPVIRQRFRYTARDGSSPRLFGMAPAEGTAGLGLRVGFR
jgi:hypothetical protein